MHKGQLAEALPGDKLIEKITRPGADRGAGVGGLLIVGVLVVGVGVALGGGGAPAPRGRPDPEPSLLRQGRA